MLQNIRDRFTGPTALIVLGLIAIPFVFVGMNSPLVGAGSAAKIDGEEISLPRFESAWQRQLAANPDILNYPPVYQNVIRQQLLDQMIRERLVDNYLNEKGIRVSERMVTDIVQQMPEFQDEDGKFSYDTYRAALASQARDHVEFEATVNQQLRQFQLQQAIASTAFVTPSEYRRYLNLYAERRRVTVATIDSAAVQDGVEISEEEIAAFYEERPEEFFTEESVDLEYIEIRRDALADNVAIDDEELQRYYEESSARYQQDEQRRARHILIPFADDEAVAREEATALAARIDAGEPFEDLARQYSKDGMTANNGGDLGLILHSQMPDALGDAIFSMRENEVRGPVRSDFGFHVVRLDEIVPGGPLPLDQVRPELERELRDQKAEARFRDLQNDISNALFDAADMQSLADAVDIDLQTATGFTRAGGEPFGSNQVVIDAVFEPRSLEDRDITDILEIDASRSAVMHVTQHHEAERRPLDEVRPQITGALKAARAQQIVAERAADLQARVQDGEALDVAAEAVGATVSEPVVISRLDENIDTRLRDTIFRSPKPAPDKPTVGASSTANGDQAVFELTAVIPGRPEAIPLAERDARKQELANQSGTSDLTAFIAELANRADIVKSDDITQDDNLFDE